MGLSCGIISVILSFAVLIQYRSVTDRQTHTDRHTHRHTTTAYTALSIASRGKKWSDHVVPKCCRTRGLGYEPAI